LAILGNFKLALTSLLVGFGFSPVILSVIESNGNVDRVGARTPSSECGMPMDRGPLFRAQSWELPITPKIAKRSGPVSRAFYHSDSLATHLPLGRAALGAQSSLPVPQLVNISSQQTARLGTLRRPGPVGQSSEVAGCTLLWAGRIGYGVSSDWQSRNGLLSRDCQSLTIITAQPSLQHLPR
jgi:hypothetical protein